MHTFSFKNELDKQNQWHMDFWGGGGGEGGVWKCANTFSDWDPQMLMWHIWSSSRSDKRLSLKKVYHTSKKDATLMMLAFKSWSYMKDVGGKMTFSQWSKANTILKVTFFRLRSCDSSLALNWCLVTGKRGNLSSFIKMTV